MCGSHLRPLYTMALDPNVSWEVRPSRQKAKERLEDGISAGDSLSSEASDLSGPESRGA